jgi:hypothetical protein
MNNNTTNIGEEERMFETKVTIKTLGYLVGEGFNRERPVSARRETRPKVIFKTETIQK